MTFDALTSLLAHKKGSQADTLFQQLFSRTHPSSIRLTESLGGTKEDSIKVTTLTANCALERAIVRKLSLKGEPDRYSGGWYATNGNETELVLTEREATAWFQRLAKDAESFLRRELPAILPTDLRAVIAETPKKDWAILKRFSDASDTTSRVVGFTAQTTCVRQSCRDPYEFSVKAVIDEDASKVQVRVTLSHNGFSTSSYLSEQSERRALNAICRRLRLQKLHLTSDLSHSELPPRELA